MAQHRIVLGHRQAESLGRPSYIIIVAIDVGRAKCYAVLYTIRRLDRIEREVQPSLGPRNVPTWQTRCSQRRGIGSLQPSNRSLFGVLLRVAAGSEIRYNQRITL